MNEFDFDYPTPNMPQLSPPNAPEKCDALLVLRYITSLVIVFGAFVLFWLFAAITAAASHGQNIGAMIRNIESANAANANALRANNKAASRARASKAASIRKQRAGIDRTGIDFSHPAWKRRYDVRCAGMTYRAPVAGGVLELRPDGWTWHLPEGWGWDGRYDRLRWYATWQEAVKYNFSHYDAHSRVPGVVNARKVQKRPERDPGPVWAFPEGHPPGDVVLSCPSRPNWQIRFIDGEYLVYSWNRGWKLHEDTYFDLEFAVNYVEQEIER